MSEYQPQEIEKGRQDFWEQKGLHKAEDFSKKPKIFLLVEFPYPSGAGLHVGHCRSYTAMDIIARKKRMQGYNVLFPMGWDAFGLPSENYAVKTGIHPSITTKQSIETFKKQEKSLGLSFDWSREINTTDPVYYKWTQWLFLKLFERGLAYKAKIPINWCLSCKIGLANEEVVDGRCERCGGDIEKREKEQWLIKITEYAQRLIGDLDLVDFPERVKIQQKEWIGKSEGYNVKFQIANCKLQIEAFTTRLDTIFGCTYLIVAPEHEIITNYKLQIINYKEIKEYIDKAKKKSDRNRQSDVKNKTGVKLEGVAAINPANGKEIPIFAADYVLSGYGTGAIMAVPGHDNRDFRFAKKYDLPIMEAIQPSEKSEILNPKSETNLNDQNSNYKTDVVFDGEGVLVNSGQFNGLKSEEAREKIGQWLYEMGLVEKKINYKLRDWVFSRQRYWGEPIPLVFCTQCEKQAGIFNFQFSRLPSASPKANGGQAIFKQKGKGLNFNQGEILNPGWIMVSESDLPVKLPDVEKYQPTDGGESPLAAINDWVNIKCPKCGGPAKRETDVMPNWSGSNWYFIRYCDPRNDKQFASPDLLKYWMPVDWYNGGMEHTTLHLLYSRFIYKFLWDIGEVPKELGPEPYKKRTSHGMILAEGGVKMSKSKGNVLNPDDVIKQYGADTLRCYEMFMGPFEQAIAWNISGVRGMRRFLERVWNVASKAINERDTLSDISGKSKLIHKTIKKVSEDIENLKFNTAISQLMIQFNNAEWRNKLNSRDEWEDVSNIGKNAIDYWALENFLLLLAPFAPHIAEELFGELKTKIRGFKVEGSIFDEEWPKYDEKLISDEMIKLIVQINGKARAVLAVDKDIEEDNVRKTVKLEPKIAKYLENKQIKRVVFVKNKLINFVL